MKLQNSPTETKEVPILKKAIDEINMIINSCLDLSLTIKNQVREIDNHEEIEAKSCKERPSPQCLRDELHEASEKLNSLQTHLRDINNRLYEQVGG